MSEAEACGEVPGTGTFTTRQGRRHGGDGKRIWTERSIRRNGKHRGINPPGVSDHDTTKADEIVGQVRGLAIQNSGHVPIFSSGMHNVYRKVVPIGMRSVAAIATTDHFWAARHSGGLLEFMRDPALTVACVLLVVVSLGWVIVTRLIVHRMKRAARRGVKSAATDTIRPARDIWSIPP